MKASDDVTMFQPARSPLSRSRVANRRASSYGSLKVVFIRAA